MYIYKKIVKESCCIDWVGLAELPIGIVWYNKGVVCILKTKDIYQEGVRYEIGWG